LQYLVDQGKKLGWQWFNAELMTTHALSKVGWITAEMQDMLAKIGPNKKLDPNSIPSFYPDFMNVPGVDSAAVDALQKMYDYQQEYLKKTFKGLKLYRTARMQLGLPFESWSRAEDIAEDFRKAYGGTLYEQLVPLENVFCFDITLPGWPTGVYQEEEVVVLGHAQMEHEKKKNASKKSTLKSTTKSVNHKATSGWSFDYDPYQNWYLPEFRLQPEIWNVPELPNKLNTTVQLKSVTGIKERIKHLRGRHDQRDHAWNRGMGRGSTSGGYAPGTMNQDQFMEMKRSLQSQIDSGAMTYEVGSAIWKRAQEIANQDFDARPANRRDAYIAQQSANQDIASAAQTMTLQNQVPQEYTDAYEIALNEVEKMANPSRSGGVIDYSQAFRKILDKYRPTDNPRTGQYDMIPPNYVNMPRDAYNYVVNKLLGEMIKAQLREDKPATLEKAQPITPNPNRPYIIPNITKSFENPVVAADKIIDDFEKLKDQIIGIESSFNVKNNYIAAIIQNLSREDQLAIIYDADAKEKLRENNLLEEVQLAIGAFGHPDARYRITEIAAKENPDLLNVLRQVNLESWIVGDGGGVASDDELKKKVAELVRYGTENLTGAHLQQAFMQVGPNKSIPINQRRHFFENGVYPPEPHPRIVQIMNNMYEETQKKLKEQGVTEIRLFRGGELQGGLPYEPWSVEEDIASRFSGIYSVQNNSSDVTDVRTAIIPAKYIFSTYVYAHFHADEYEFPVLSQAMYADQNVDVEIMRYGAEPVTSDALVPKPPKEVINYLKNVAYEREQKKLAEARIASEKPRDDALKTVLGTSKTFSLTAAYFPTDDNGAYENLDEKTISLWEKQLKILNEEYANFDPVNEARAKARILYLVSGMFRQDASDNGLEGTKEYYQIMKIFGMMKSRYEDLADNIDYRDGVLTSVLGTDKNFALDKENYPRLMDDLSRTIGAWSIKEWKENILPILNEKFTKFNSEPIPEGSIASQDVFENTYKVQILKDAKNDFQFNFDKEEAPQVYNDISRIFDTMINKYRMEQTRFIAEANGMTLQEFIDKQNAGLF